MKKKILLLGLLVLGLSSCENMKIVGNKMTTGAYTYYYAYVKSQITGDAYYHIKGWAEYGPEGGDMGGEIVATGTPEEIVKNKKSYTGEFLKQYLK